METKTYYTLDDTRPFAPIHPGEMLLDELQARRLSQRKFAELIGCSYSFLNEIIKGKRSITTETALKIEAATGIKAYIWVRLQAAYNMQTAKADRKLNDLLAQIRQAAALL